ncbi:PAS domain S-box-containing protein [Actinoplanes lutulentus]|uniref:PAS domain S-box-containing protein n=1 Tax=Actinoplanes lutulentus TaxID=1287878 RepID=A0A327YZ86_9ACTN|nr:PAS domain-containing protein [Actinoplanes lutulentus]MBB2942089.1 PAS domain S-box-containing protein [Actinoplanes lutulentus]RAK26957.1 PAS domain S-box-containing protein [Actinoplanes lutulentus]
MRLTQIRPTGTERTFSDGELIVTKTDPHGVITYANDVFLRISALSEAEAVGQPHNVIRHPDMPRSVFKLLWDTVQDGREIFAYVVNLAADGAHYWVFAHVTPSFDSAGRVIGYHSNRRVPSRPAVAAADELYGQLRAAERRHDRTQDAVEAGEAALRQVLDERGRTYDELVWDIASGSRRP